MAAHVGLDGLLHPFDAVRAEPSSQQDVVELVYFVQNLSL